MIYDGPRQQRVFCPTIGEAAYLREAVDDFFCYYIKKYLYICKFYWFAISVASQCKLVL